MWRTFAKIPSKSSNAMAKALPLKVAIFTEMENLVKIANLANIRQGVSKNSNEMTKCDMRVAILTKMVRVA